MTSRNELSTLERLRPTSTVDNAWPAAARDAALERLLLAADSPAPRPAPARRRRLLLTATLTAGLLATGGGIATAGGLLPASFTDQLTFWSTETGGAAEVQTARRVAQAPGPDGTALTVWSTRTANGTVCVAPMFEAPGPLDRPAPADFQLAGGSCERESDTDRDGGTFSGVSGSADDHGTHTMWAVAGDAVRAELRLADGSTRPAVLAEGQFFFWYLANEQVAAPTLVGYDAAGTVLAEHQLPDLAQGDR